MTTFTEAYLERVTSLVETLPVADIERAIEMLCEAYQRGARVFVMGNGGSAAAASHFVCVGGVTCLEGSNPSLSATSSPGGRGGPGGTTPHPGRASRRGGRAVECGGLENR